MAALNEICSNSSNIYLIFHNQLQLLFYWRVLHWILYLFFFPYLNFCHYSINVKVRKRKECNSWSVIFSGRLVFFTSHKSHFLLNPISVIIRLWITQYFFKLLAVKTSLQNIWKFKSDVTVLQKSVKTG